MATHRDPLLLPAASCKLPGVRGCGGLHGEGTLRPPTSGEEIPMLSLEWVFCSASPGGPGPLSPVTCS